MVKGVVIGVYPVMTGQAVRAEGLGVGSAKGCIHLVMAGVTGLLIEMGEIGAVAVSAGERRTVGLLLMGLQRETNLIVRKILQGVDCRRSIWPIVIWMATVAGEHLALRQHHAMEAARVLQQAGVACLATVGHFLAVERAGVASGCISSRSRRAS